MVVTISDKETLEKIEDIKKELGVSAGAEAVRSAIKYYWQTLTPEHGKTLTKD